MKRQNFYSLALKASAVALLMSGVGLTATAQDLVNQPAGKIQNTGTIKFKKNGAKLTNNAPVADQTMDDGTVEFNGTSAVYDGTNALGSNGTTNRFPGTVRWAGNSGTQVVSGIAGAEYYTNLILDSAGLKSISEDIYVSEVYDVLAQAGDRTYASDATFFYDGGDQRIFPETGVAGNLNQYSNLELIKMASLPAGEVRKSVDQASAIKLIGTFQSNADATLVIGGQFAFGSTATADGNVLIDSIAAASLTIGSGLATLNADVTVTKGQFNMPSASQATIGTDGSLALADDTDAKVDLDATAQLTITGTYTNAFAALTNTTYDATSTVTYNGTAANQVIVPTVETNPYGNLTTDAGAKYAGGNIFLATDLTVNGGDLDMTAGTNGTTTDYELTMGLGQAIYGAVGTPTDDEVRGKMVRTGAFATAAAYTYNNTNTQLTFTDAGAGLPTSFGLRVLGEVSPHQFAAGTDIQRKITPTYTGGGTDWVSTIRAGYKEENIDVAAWAGEAIPTLENSLRFVETQDKTAPNVEKIATGNAYTRDAADVNIRWVSLAGITPSTLDVDGIGDGSFKSANDLVLRGGPVIFNAIADGRWSNPETWDEGTEPTSQDYAVINGFTVHAGYVRASDNYSTAEASPADLARGIWVGSNNEASTPTLDNSGLIFGTINGESGTVPSFSMTASSVGQLTMITNKGGATTPTAVNLAGAPDATAADINGLIIYAGSTLQSDNLTNEGRIGNAGNVEIGD